MPGTKPFTSGVTLCSTRLKPSETSCVRRSEMNKALQRRAVLLFLFIVMVVFFSKKCIGMFFVK
jgi:hypothetical protein